jgi:hypothetical protein
MTPATIATAGAILVAIIAAWGEVKKHETNITTENRLTSLEHRMTAQEANEK